MGKSAVLFFVRAFVFLCLLIPFGAQAATNKIVRFELVNADTDKDIRILKNNDKIDYSKLSTKNISVRAVTNPTSVGSVRFTLKNKSNNDNVKPYSLGAKSETGISAYVFANGTYSLQAYPYSKKDAKGSRGTGLKITFQVAGNTVSASNTPSPTSKPTIAPTATAVPTPTPNPFLINAKMVEVGNSHSCTLMVDGSVRCWGSNTAGQLGDGTTVSKSSPIAVSGITNAVTISSGYTHTCAVLSTGSIKCWGKNEFGELGDGTTTNRTLPVFVNGISNAVSVSAGEFDTCAVLNNGSVMCWGNNGQAQGGNGTTTERIFVPTAVLGVTNATKVSAADEHTCALLSDGSIKCWGSNTSGTLGDGTDDGKKVPVKVVGITNAIDVSVGDFHTCAVLSGGSVECWGDNSDGQLGDNTKTERHSPTPVIGISNATSISAGIFHSCAVLNNGSLKCWGPNSRGQLGDGSTTDRISPIVVSGISDAVQVSAGGYHTCALKSTGNVVCWGLNQNGRLGDGTTIQRNTPSSVVAGSLPPVSAPGGTPTPTPTSTSAPIPTATPTASPSSTSSATPTPTPTVSIERVSLSSTGQQGTRTDTGGIHTYGAESYQGVISSGGRYVAFQSDAMNFGAEDHSQVFLKDRQTGVLTMLSRDYLGNPVFSPSGFGVTDPAISADGRYVSFTTGGNLLANDSNFADDIYIRDTVAGTTSRVSTDSAGNQATGGDSGHSSISSTGRYVAFESRASNLVSPGVLQYAVVSIFLKDTQTGATTLISSDASGVGGYNDSSYPKISPSGRYVVFNSNANNLVLNDTNGHQDVFLKDSVTGAISLVSSSASGVPANQDSYVTAVSQNARYVVFYSLASNLIPGTSGALFIKDTQTGAISKVPNTEIYNNDPGHPISSLSADGKYLVYDGFDLVDNNLPPGVLEVFVRDNFSGALVRLIKNNGGSAGGAHVQVSISPDGKFITFDSEDSDDPNLIPPDTNKAMDVFEAANPLSP